MKKIDLNQNWCIRCVDQKECFYSDVPATVAAVLYENHVIADSYYGENEWETYEVLKKDYEFTNTFLVSDEMLNEDQVLLRCEGIDTAADIYINDQKVMFVNDMHRTYEFDVKALLTEGENHIRIYFHSNIEYALSQHTKEPYYTTSDTVDGFSLVRKAHSTYGWDWGPKLPDMGIWRAISIVSYEDAKISDIYIRQRHEEESVTLQFDIDVEKFVPAKDVELEISVTAPDGTVVGNIGGQAKETGSYDIVVEKPELWWCNGFGEQPLYEVKFVLRCGDVLLEEQKKRIGLRTLTVRKEKDQWGESFEFCVNGVSIFAMGANYIPEDSIYPRCSKERSRKLIEQCVKANYNCIRVWGGGYFCEDYFYDLCDEYGLIVWQDLLFACGVYRLHDDFVQNVIAETRDNVRRLRHHASIALWCGNNELEWGWSGWDMGFGNKLSDKADYLKLFEWILPNTVKEIDPDRFYWLASPSSGGSFDDPNDQNRGDVHYWEVWHRLKHFTEYRKYYFRFCSEFGFQSFPSMKTINSFAEEKDKNIFSPVMENHQKNGGANGLILYYLSANFLYPSKFSTLLYVSQILQAEAIRYGVEHWRSNRGRCMGSLYWQVNDCWPVASWSSLDYYHRWKPLHYYAKKFYAPLLLCALEEKGHVRFVVCNETREDVSAKIVWRLRNHKGTILEEHSAECNAVELSATECAAADYSKVLEQKKELRTQYLEYILYRGDEEISRNTLLFCRSKHFGFQNPELTYSVKELEDRYELSFHTENYAKYVFVDAEEFDFVASDNCFDLSKGEEKIIEIRKSDITKNGELYQIRKEDLEKLQLLTAYDIR
ncbi:glycoside hydrolase family 2 protein [Faecalicatena sp. Marseille-Q4148]|nr:glycoside hydrolase family 2 protein [Faecalicatena sp. Marseille-Q4148]